MMIWIQQSRTESPFSKEKIDIRPRRLEAENNRVGKRCRAERLSGPSAQGGQVEEKTGSKKDDKRKGEQAAWVRSKDTWR